MLLLGYSDAALADTKQALEYARARALRRNADVRAEFQRLPANPLRPLRRRERVLGRVQHIEGSDRGVFWGGWGLALRGCVLTLTGEPRKRPKTSHPASLRSDRRETRMWTPLFLTSIGLANGKIGRLDEAWTNIREASRQRRGSSGRR